MLLEPKPDNPCFGCGGPGFIHGGIIAVLLDEAVGKVSRFRQVRAVTAGLVIEYLKFVGVDEDLIVEAREVERNGRVLQRTGEIRNSDGEVLARGRGRFVEIDPARIGSRSAAKGASSERIAKS